jgi:DNA-binding beta-propeller fold protein YncE
VIRAFRCLGIRRLKSQLQQREVGLRRLRSESAQADFAPFQPATSVAGSTAILLVLVASIATSGCHSVPHSPQPVRIWGEPGRHDGQFHQPRSVDFLLDGSVVVLDRSDRVQLFTPEGRWLRTWRVPTVARGNPRGLDIGPDGLIYVADTHNSRILVYDARGHLHRQWGRYGKGPGEFIWVTDVAVDGRGHVYSCEHGGYNDRVQKFDSHGRFMLQCGTIGERPGQFQRPQGIATDRAGNVYVADAVNHRVQKLSPAGAVLATWGHSGTEPGRLRYPYDVALDGSDHVYVIEYGNQRVSVFDTGGRFLKTWGRPGRGPGEFDHPWGIGVDARGQVYVADTRNGRIQVFGAGDQRRATNDQRPTTNDQMVEAAGPLEISNGPVPALAPSLRPSIASLVVGRWSPFVGRDP